MARPPTGVVTGTAALQARSPASRRTPTSASTRSCRTWLLWPFLVAAAGRSQHSGAAQVTAPRSSSTGCELPSRRAPVAAYLSTRPRRGGGRRPSADCLHGTASVRSGGPVRPRSPETGDRGAATRRRRNSPPASKPGIRRRGRDPRAGHADCPPVPAAPVLHHPPLVVLRLLQLCSPEVKRRAHQGASLQGRRGKVPPRPCPRGDEMPRLSATPRSGRRRRRERRRGRSWPRRRRGSRWRMRSRPVRPGARPGPWMRACRVGCPSLPCPQCGSALG